MSKDGFEQDDLSSTLARFAGKGRGIVHDESKLKRKAQEPIVLPSATQELGSAVFSCMISAISHIHESHKKTSARIDNEYKRYEEIQEEDDKARKEYEERSYHYKY